MHDVKYLLPIGATVFNTHICTICTYHDLHYPQHGGESINDKIIQYIHTIWTIAPDFSATFWEWLPRPSQNDASWEQKLGSGDGNGCVMVRQCVYDVNLQIAHTYQYDPICVF